MTVYLRQVAALVRKDLTLELRTRERLMAMGAFAVLAGVLFSYALDPTLVRPGDVASGFIWLTVVFGGLLGVGRTFALEEEEGAIHGVLLSPIPRDAVYLAKVLSNFVLVGLAVILVLLVFGLFFGLQLRGNPVLLGGVVGLGALGFVAITTLFAAISHRTTMGDTLLPILVFPLLVPVVIYGASATARIFAGRPPDEITGSLRMLAAFAIVALGGGASLFRFVVEE
jgi:heme exporter protein B